MGIRPMVAMQQSSKDEKTEDNVPVQIEIGKHVKIYTSCDPKWRSFQIDFFQGRPSFTPSKN